MNTFFNIKRAKKALLFMPLIAAATVFSSCDDFLDITPTGKIIAKTGDEYRALLTYEYKYFPSDRGMSTVRTDEMSLAKAYTSDLDYDTYFDLWRWNDSAPATTTTYFGWRGYYHAIYISNYIIEHKNEISDASTAQVNQLVGESYMMRAYAHFLLANLYAAPYTNSNPETTRGIPVQTKADVNALPRSSSLKAVYEQVLGDIAEAEKHLNQETWETGYNYRFNAVSAKALKARVCLYMGDWQGALDASKEVITARPELEDLTTTDYKLPSRFDSKESIVALEKTMSAEYSVIGRPSTVLLALYRSGDQRRTAFYRRVTASATTLLKGGSQDFNCTFRTSEFYLTAAEAAIRLGEKDDALNYLKTLAGKRYNSATFSTYISEIESMDNNALLTEILNERARELAFEGHRWFDLRRTTMPELTKTYEGQTYTLAEKDSRYTLRFPSEAVEANPEIELWN